MKEENMMIRLGQPNWNISLRLSKVIAIITSILLMVIISSAQDRNPTRGYKAGNSYSISDIENVNLSNGNLMMHIPLASLPAGKGTSPGYTVALNYNSKLWNSKQERRTDGIGSNPEDLYYIRELVEPSEQGGWYLDSGGYRLSLYNRLGLEAEAPCMEYSGADAYRRNGYVFKLKLQLPDGSIKEFLPFGSGIAYSDYYADGYFSLDPYGVRHIYSYTTDPMSGHPICVYSTEQITTAGINYYTDDGSGLRLFLPYQPTLSVPLMRWTLYFPDGRILENKPPDDTSVSQRLTDLNGNNLVWKGATINGISGSKIENEAGHYIFIGWDNGDYKIIQHGVNGELLETTIEWTDTWVYHNYRATNAPNANSPFLYEDLYQSLGMVSKITLPLQSGGLEYNFAYNGDNTPPATGNYTDGFGELKSITLPSGAKADYSYSLDGNTVELQSFDVLGNNITQRVLTYERQYDGSTEQVTETTGYGAGPGIGGMCNPDGGCKSEVAAIGGDLNGYAYRISQTDGFMVEKIWVNKRYMGGSVYAKIEPFVKTEFTTVADASGNPTLTATKDFDYDQNGNILEIREYDWVSYSSIPRSSTGEVNEYLPVPRPTGLPSGLVLKRKTVNTYYNPTPNTTDPLPNSTNHYSNPNSPLLKRLIKSTEIQDGSGNPVSRTEFIYDNSQTNPTKGNLTETRVWDSTKAALGSPDTNGFRLNTLNSISTTTQYDQYGNPILITDAKGVQTQITYGNIQGPNGTITDLYPTETKGAFNTVVQRTARMEYDFYTGAITRAIDVDNNVSTATTYDALGRPTLVKAAEGTAIETRTATEYNDAQRYVVVRSDLNTTGDGKHVSIQNYDQLGRVRLTRTLEDSTTQSPYNEQDGIKVQTRYLASGSCTTFAGNCSYALSSNPYRAAKSFEATNETTMSWSRSKADNGGRVREIETFSGASLPAPFGSNTNSTGVVVTDYDADRTLVTDQSGKKRISRINALGQLTDVWEITAQDSSTVAVSFPNQPSVTAGYQTSYTYDTLSNLTEVNQGIQTRTFTYSSLSRLLSATNPESGTISYAYDNGGNLLTKQDARNITTTYTYDELSRVKTRSYSDGITSQVTYTYDDSTIPFGKGKLTKVSSSVSETSYTSFDALGRLLTNKQTTDGTAYTMSYTYNIAGGLVSQTYPSGRVVTNTFDNDGSLTNVSSKANSTATPRTYANAFVYAPSGAVSSMRLGNGRFESTVFNSRLQPTQIALGTSASNTSLLKLDYDYGNSDNNGNVKSQTITVPNMANPLVQTYSYDSLNRLLSATETVNSVQKWKQAFTFDRYGNRRIDTTQTAGQNQTETTSLTGPNPVISESNNRIVPQTGEQYLYDSAGNLTRDKDGNTFVYDGENKQTIYNGGAGTSTPNGANYFYDGDGKRIKKLVGTSSIVTIFVYDASGKLVAEYETNAPQTGGKIQYATQDTLGSPRVLTDERGEVTSRRDFLPFGEEITNLSGRTSDYKYGQADNVKQKFTSKERDGETGLDYFGERYYTSGLGRFTTVDPLGASVRASNPQTFNRYVYVLNNPLRYIDPDGMKDIDAWSLLTSEEQKILSEKLGQNAKATFNKSFTVVGKDNLTRENVIAIQNLIDVLGGKSNSAVWQQVKSIDAVYANKNHMLAITVKDLGKFKEAMTAEKDSSGRPKYYFDNFAERKPGKHPNDSIRQNTEYSSDYAIHLANDDSKNKNVFFVHWDPASANFWTQDLKSFPNTPMISVFGIEIGEVKGSGYLKEKLWAAEQHNIRSVSPSTVRQHLKDTKQSPTY
jgi:RHS repeat-associated protein